MNTNETKPQAGEPETRLTTFAYYKGHVIDVKHCGHPQAQNIFIDGALVGHVIFPTSALAVARGIIDQREEAQPMTPTPNIKPQAGERTQGKLSLDPITGATIWAPPIKLTFEQRDQARRLEEWVVDHAEEAAFEIIHLRNLLAKQQEAQP